MSQYRTDPAFDLIFGDFINVEAFSDTVDDQNPPIDPQNSSWASPYDSNTIDYSFTGQYDYSTEPSQAGHFQHSDATYNYAFDQTDEQTVSQPLLSSSGPSQAGYLQPSDANYNYAFDQTYQQTSFGQPTDGNMDDLRLLGAQHDAEEKRKRNQSSSQNDALTAINDTNHTNDEIPSPASDSVASVSSIHSESSVERAAPTWSSDVASITDTNRVLNPQPTHLTVDNDDWQAVKAGQNQEWAKSLLAAIFQPGDLDGPVTGRHEDLVSHFQKQQAASLDACFSLTEQQHDQLDLQAKCLIAVDAIVALHEHGVPGDILTQKSKIWKPNMTLKCSARLQQMLDLLANYKKAAEDFIKIHPRAPNQYQRMAIDPVGFGRRIISHVGSNARRDKVTRTNKPRGGKSGKGRVTRQNKRAGDDDVLTIPDDGDVEETSSAQSSTPSSNDSSDYITSPKSSGKHQKYAPQISPTRGQKASAAKGDPNNTNGNEVGGSILQSESPSGRKRGAAPAHPATPTKRGRNNK